jgi:segregation and condensation protein B
MTEQPLKSILEAALFTAGKPLTIDHFIELFEENERPERSTIRAALKELTADYTEHGIELVQVSSGYRFQTKQDLIPWLKRLQPERSPRYSRALLETIAIIAYRQPITRAEIEKIRGISVSTDLMKRLIDYNWIRILAHRNTPGRPALYGTTREFLNYFNLKSLNDLPPLMELKEIVEAQTELLKADNPELDENKKSVEIDENQNDETSKLLEMVETETQTELKNAENQKSDENQNSIEIDENQNNETPKSLDLVKAEIQTELFNGENPEPDENQKSVEIEDNKNHPISEQLERQENQKNRATEKGKNRTIESVLGT